MTKSTEREQRDARDAAAYRDIPPTPDAAIEDDTDWELLYSDLLG